MANYCNYEMKIQGESEAIAELCDMLAWSGKYKEDGINGVWEFDISEKGDNWIVGYGCCANSVESSMMSNHRHLVAATLWLSLAVEVYSVETDMCFQEHIIIGNAGVIENQCVDYLRIDEDTIADDELLSEAAYNLGISVEEILDNINEEGEYTRGGFDNWGKFSDLSEYLDLQPNAIEEGIAAMEKHAVEGTQQQEAVERDSIDVER